MNESRADTKLPTLAEDIAHLRQCAEAMQLRSSIIALDRIERALAERKPPETTASVAVREVLLDLQESARCWENLDPEDVGGTSLGEALLASIRNRLNKIDNESAERQAPELPHYTRKARPPEVPICSLATGHSGDCNGAPRTDCPSWGKP